MVQDATDLQAFNHYAYVRNNPLSLTDPSGFSFLGGIFNAIGKFFTGVFKAVANAVKAIPPRTLTCRASSSSHCPRPRRC